MSCLDLGCGSSDLTFELARLVGDDGHVTGIDVDEQRSSWLARSPKHVGSRT
jgi:ubiquinone/menaquinone biosynthesis C-methylase UbiE